MFIKFARHLKEHPLHRHLTFLGLGFLAVLVNGYHFGTFDQVFHIPFLLKFISPELYPNDPFLDLRLYHFSLFWFPFIPLYKAGLLEISMFIVHILTVYGTVWMFWALTDELFNNDLASLLVALALIVPHLGFPGFQIIEFSLLNRTFVLPFLLGVILLYLKGKKIPAFILLGALFNLHVIYAVFVLCMLLFHELLTFKWRNWWRPVLQLVLFTIAGLPVLLWRMDTGSGIDFTLRPEMVDFVARGLLFTDYFPLSTAPYVIGNLLAGAGTVWAFVLGYRLSPQTPKHRIMRDFALAIGILVLVGTVASYLLPVTILIQMQILRVGVFMLYFGMIYFSFFISKRYEDGSLSKQNLLILSLGYILIPTVLVPILIYFVIRYLARARKPSGWLLPVVVAIPLAALAVAIPQNFWSPGIQILGPQSEWREVQEWAKDNTDPDALFITPPQIFWHYTSDWRVFSQRSTVVTIPELMEIPFYPPFEQDFKRRLNDIAPGAMEQFSGNYIQTLEVTGQAFYTNTTEDFVRQSCTYQADYLVVEQGHSYDLTQIY
jgi:hypothetical protein